MPHWVRDCLIGQQTRPANAIRAHLWTFGIVVAKGVKHINKLLREAASAGLLKPMTGSRDLLAWLGLTPKPHSSGGKVRA